jgi:hypothetical protein
MQMNNTLGTLRRVASKYLVSFIPRFPRIPSVQKPWRNKSYNSSLTAVVVAAVVAPLAAPSSLAAVVSGSVLLLLFFFG